MISMHSPSALTARGMLLTRPTNSHSPRRSSDSVLSMTTPPPGTSAFYVGKPDALQPEAVNIAPSCIFYRELYGLNGKDTDATSNPSVSPNSSPRRKAALKTSDTVEPEVDRDTLLARNRAIASRSRARRRERLEQLETDASQLGLDNSRLQADAWALKSEVLQLRTIVNALDGVCCAGGAAYDNRAARKTERAWNEAESAAVLSKIYSGDLEADDMDV